MNLILFYEAPGFLSLCLFVFSRLPVFSSRWRLLPVHPVYAVRRNGRSWLVFSLPLKYAIPDRKGQRRLSPGPFRLRLGGGAGPGFRINQPEASFAGSSGLRRPEKWALMACFSHAAEVCYT